MKPKVFALLVLIFLLVAAIVGFQRLNLSEDLASDEFYFGVSFGGQTPEEARGLIDKVKNYTNFFLINSYDLATNETALNEVCEYATQAGLKFTVYFEFISRVTYPWHQTWLDSAQTRWNNSFLGVYLHDEPGGKQIDDQKTFSAAANYSEAANLFVGNTAQSNSMIDAKTKSVQTFTSDYVLYWWDYLSGYDVVFVELGWQLNSTQQIALCRGAATMQNKIWGAILVWSQYEPPYMASAQELYQDMLLAYGAGAKYVSVFNYPTYPKDNPYGVLSEEHFRAMENFWRYVRANPRPKGGVVQANTALVLPSDYGWGMRRNEHLPVDNIWGLWPEDEKVPIILENINKLLTQYGTDFDIVFDDIRFNLNDKYNRVYEWDQFIP
ncbi:MAG: hypothetical protein LBQ98_03915 [Nitrososphaerota archaeon]|jgi:hypothetical protein|nr:hypothetical protein [Nitrososphaerota archaeon]